MDQKKTQRIIGIVIVIALVIILFPVLFSKNEPKSTVTTVKAPPFPDQTSSQLDVAENTQPSQDEVIIDQPTPVSAEDGAVPSIQPENSADITATEINVEPSPQNSETQNKPKELSANTKLSEPVTAKPTSNVAVLDQLVDKATQEQTKQTKKMVTAKAKPHASKHEAAKLSEIAWAVQMGSFRDKDNARRLVNKLRSAGYQAFTREVNAKYGSQMRVYVGPEYKHVAAVKLSSELQENMNIHGIVIAYKPLAL